MKRTRVEQAPSVLRWHYTVGDRLAGIFQDNVIEPSPRDGSPSPRLPGERPAVWFSVRTDWEPTACKVPPPDGRWPGMAEAMRGDHELGGGLYRIGVRPSVASVHWSAYRKKCGLPHHFLSGLVDAARRCGANPMDWFVRFGPVPVDLWETVEEWHPGEGVWEAGQWIALPEVAEAAAGE